MADPARLSAVIAAYLAAADRGERPGRDEVLAAHPDLADELRDFLAAEARLEAAVSPGRKEPDADDPDHTIGGLGASAPWGDARAPAGYVIEGELGRGGMGVVYLARHLGLDRPCALKMILSGAHAGDAEAARFKTEAQAIARLNHPGIVQVYEVGEHDGRPFMALEFCPGGSLDKKLAKNPLPPREAAELVRALAEAMQAAHDADVIHRDLKPANVLLTVDRQPKVTDFGLAKKLDEAGRTKTGAVLGTPSYMPPEQARGERHLGPTADVYSLGAILYECLTGRPPFRAATALDTLLQVLSDEPVPLRQLNARVPQDLETIAHKCLHKDPGRRYASARDLADDLRRYLDGRPIQARPVGALERGYRWVKRNPIVSALAAAVLLVLTAGVVAAWLLAAWALNEKVKAEGLAKAESEAKGSAQRERDRAEWEVYLGRMILTRQALAAGNPSRAVLYLEQCPRGQRGWEHRFLWTSLTSRQTLHGHPDVVRGVAWSPDGRRIASAGRDATVRVWDAATGREVAQLAGRAGWVTCLAWSPDGQRIASGGADGVLTVWDVDRGRVVFHLEGHPDMVESVAYRPDGKHLASASDDRTVRVWDAETGREVRTLNGHAAVVLAVAYRPDGKRLVSGSLDGTMKVWDADDGREVRTIDSADGLVESVAYSPDGKRLVSNEGKVRDADNGQVLLSLKADAPRMSLTAYSPDGDRIAGGYDEAVKVWDARTGEEVLTLHGHTGNVLGLAWSPDGRRIASGGGDRNKPGEVKVWDAEAGQQVRTLRGHTRAVFSAAYHPDGDRIATAGGDGALTVWDAVSGRALRSWRGHAEAATRLGYSPDGKRLASGGGDGTVRVWDADTGQEVRSLQGHAGPVTCVGWCPAGRRIATGGTDKTVRVWDARTGREVRAPLVHLDRVACLAWSPDGRRIASEGAGETVRVWDAETGEEVQSLPGHTGPVYCVAFSPGGKRLAGGGDGAVSVWDVAKGRLVLSLAVHTARVNSVAWSPDGERLVSGDGDGTLTVWSAETGQEVLSHQGHDEAVSSVAWGPDGHNLVSGSLDRTAKVWRADRSQEVCHLHGHSGDVTRVGFSPDGQRVYGWGSANQILAWSVADGRAADLGEVPPEPAPGPAVSPDGSLRAEARGRAVAVFDPARVARANAWPLPDAAERKRYHTEQAARAEKEKRWFAVAFHVGRLLLDDPDSADLKERRAKALAKHSDRPLAEPHGKADKEIRPGDR